MFQKLRKEQEKYLDLTARNKGSTIMAISYSNDRLGTIKKRLEKVGNPLTWKIFKSLY